MKKLVIAGVAALALSACQGRAPENALDEGNIVEENLTAPIENVAMPEPVNATNAVEPPAAPPPTFSQDEQMRDDADATGLTSRLPDEAPGQGDNETRPAE
jgi:hypothetical protein